MQAGAYRLAVTSDLLPKTGLNGLIASTLFHYQKEFFDRVGPAIELGRSFIVPECQKSYAALLLLWKAILRQMQRCPKARVLFGAVSISQGYCSALRGLLANYLLHHESHALAGLVRSRAKFRDAVLRKMSVRRFAATAAGPPRSVHGTGGSQRLSRGSIMSPRAIFLLLVIISGGAAVSDGQNDADWLIERGHWKRARALVEARLRERPDDPLANFQLSQIRNAFGDRTTPLELAEKALRLDGGTARYHRQVAEVLGVMAQHSGAFKQLFLARRFRKEIDAALALDPRDPQALRDLLEFYLLAPGIAGGDVKKAIGLTDRILAVNAPRGFLAKARVATFQKRDTEAEANLRKAVEADPPSFRARITAAEYFFAPEHRNLETAEGLAREALRLDATRADSYVILAGIAADRGDWKSLDSILASSAKAVPDDPAPYYRAADRLLAANRDPSLAERYLRTYLAQPSEGNQPAHAEAQWKLGLALERQNRKSEAITCWKESVKLDRESPAAGELKRVS